MSKDELIRKYSCEWVGGMTSGDEERVVYPAMDEYAKQQAIEFFKWNARVISEYLDYLRRVDRAGGVSEKETELNIFENASIQTRYNLFIESQKKAQCE